MPEETLERLQRVEERLSTVEKALVDVRGDMAALRGTLDSWDRTVDRMAEYQRSHAMLQEEVRRLKRSQGNPRIDEDPTEAAAGPDLPASTSASDPMCCGCKKYLAYDAPMSVFLRCLTGDEKMDLGDLFTLPGGRVKANSKAKKHVRCAECMPAGALRLIVYTSGGGGGRRQCDWCRATYSNQMTDSASGWCGSKHSSCRSLVIENETNRQGNSQFLAKGVAAVKEVVPWDEVKLIDVGLKEQWNDADYVIVATSSLGKALVILEVDNRAVEKTALHDIRRLLWQQGGQQGALAGRMDLLLPRLLGCQQDIAAGLILIASTMPWCAAIVKGGTGSPLSTPILKSNVLSAGSRPPSTS